MKDYVNVARNEDKYILTHDQYKALGALVDKHLPLFNYGDGIKPEWTRVTSRYFDSYDLVCFKKHISDEANRSKVRTRKYMSEGKWDGKTYVEIKEKIDGEDHKSRFCIDSGNLMSLNGGRDISITPGLRALNSKMPAADLRKVVNRLNTLVKSYQMKPRISTSYERRAHGSDKLRVTCDTDLSCRSLKSVGSSEAQRIRDRVDWDHAKKLASRYEDSKAILEIKHQGNVPSWLSKFLEDNKIEKVKFSKYVYACVKDLKKLLGGKDGN